MGSEKFDRIFLHNYEDNYPFALNLSDYGLQCVKCKEVKLLSPCDNCGSTSYSPGKSTDRQRGLFCSGCDRGFTRWTCSNCGTDNAVEKTFGEAKRGGCFIATAVYGSYDSPEVLVLRTFRDAVLEKKPIGRMFIKCYYTISPFIAKALSGKKLFKFILKFIIFRPIVNFLKKRKNIDHPK